MLSEVQETAAGRVETEMKARRAGFGLSLSKFLSWAALLTAALCAVGWLILPAYLQFLVLAVVVLITAAGSLLYPFFYRREQAALGAYVCLGSLLFTASIAPLVFSTAFPGVALAYMMIIVMSIQMLGDRQSRVFIGIIVVVMGIIGIVTNLWVPPWPVTLDETINLVGGTVLNLISLLTGALLMRLIVLGQEEQFRQAQLATLEVEKRAAAEQAQRERIEQANAEIERRIAAEQEQRAHLEAQREKLEQANAEIEARMATEQEQREKLEQANAEIEARAAAEQKQREYLQAMVERYVAYTLAVGQGNLNLQLDLDKGDEDDPLLLLGRSLNESTANLRQMIQQVRDAAEGVASAAAEIQAATTQQMSSTGEQEAAVAQTMTTVEEVRATVTQTAQRAHDVAETAGESVEISRAGQGAIEDAVEGMVLIRQRVEAIAENILLLSKHTQQIGDIIATVNDIADQSKMLALNASIEAARAGEEGKGFGVVAMEVRQLAEQSREATARVRDILSEIQGATNTAVMVTEEGSKGADQGVARVDRAGEAIRNLAAVIEEASQAATQIAASTHQQTNGMDQLAAAMASIKQASAQAAASTRQAEQSAHDLLAMARQMEETVSRYRL